MSLHRPSASERTHLRVGTFNVHGYCSRTRGDTFDEICDLLREADLDIIGLQEAGKSRLGVLVKKLGEDQYRLAASGHGTAIVTRLGETCESPQGLKCKERFTRCSLSLPSKADNRDKDPVPLEVINVHLNHRKEPVRISQFRNIRQAHDESKTPLPHIWLGDFNALTRSDYSEMQWQEILNVRAHNSWELPVSHLTTMITSQQTKQKKDKKLALDLSDSYTASRRTGPLSTCRFGTRIDYIYFNESYLQAAGWRLASYLVEETDLSDHNLVIATFERVGDQP